MLTIRKGKDGEIIEQVILSDYKSEEEMHDLFVKLGFEKISAEEQEKMREERRIQEQEEQQKYHEEKVRLAQERQEKQRQEMMKRHGEREEELRRRHAEMKMKERMTEQKNDPPKNVKYTQEEYQATMLEMTRLNKKAERATELKEEYYKKMKEVEAGTRSLSDNNERVQMNKELDHANKIIEMRGQLKEKLDMLKSVLSKEEL